MSPSSHGPLTSEQATVLTERAAVAQGVGGASAASRKTKASSGPEIPLGGKKPGVLQPAGGPHVLIYGLSPCPFRTKKNFPPPADNLLGSHHLKLCGCEGDGRGWEEPHTTGTSAQRKNPSSRSDSCQLPKSQHFSCFSFFIFKWQDGLKGTGGLSHERLQIKKDKTETLQGAQTHTRF